VPTEARGSLVEIADLSKNYQGLRPFRIEKLQVGTAERVALLGLDEAMAATLVNLVTGATLPDRGTVTIFGRTTASIDNSADWLAIVDRFGIVSERAVLLEAFSVLQNLAMPFTLEIDPPSDEFRQRAAILAEEVGLPAVLWSRPVSELDAVGRLRLRIARALALDPSVLVLEHVSAGLATATAEAIGTEIRRVAERRACAVVAATLDRRFAEAVATRVLTHDPATGRVAGPPRTLLHRLFHN
jgi:ABC-type transporter Mla maintaining outer membrane lipid asymmetry ATPase subunit MlaF